MVNPDPTSSRLIFEYEHLVGEHDLDEMRHVNNLNYLRWCLRAAVKHSEQVGWGPNRYREIGCGFIVRSHRIKYRVPALLDDRVIIRTWIANMEKVSSDRKYEIRRVSDQRKLAEAETTWVFVDLETMELRRIPDEIRDSFRQSNPVK